MEATPFSRQKTRHTVTRMVCTLQLADYINVEY
jgi:hypothetical protein